MISMLVWILVLVLVFGAVFYIVQTLLPLPEPWKRIALIIIGLIFVLILLSVVFPPLFPYWRVP